MHIVVHVMTLCVLVSDTRYAHGRRDDGRRPAMRNHEPKSNFMRLATKYGPVILLLLSIIDRVLRLVSQVANYKQDDELRIFI